MKEIRKETRGKKPDPRGPQKRLNGWAYNCTIEKLAEISKSQKLSKRATIELAVDKLHADTFS